jgi:hypothetical protein
MYAYRVTYKIFKEELQKIIEIDEYIEDNEILEEVILDKLIEHHYIWERNYKVASISITNIAPCEGCYTNKELNNCTEDNKLC